MSIPIPQVDRPTVVVHLTSGGLLEAVCADGPVRVICVDYSAEDDVNAVAPDGDRAQMWEQVFGHPPLWADTNPDLTAEYEHALAAGPAALEDDA